MPGLNRGVSGLAIGTGLLPTGSGLWNGSTGFVDGAVSYDPAAQAYFAAMTVQPSTAMKTKLNARIVALKAGGCWDLLDWISFYDFGVQNDQGALLNVKNPAQTASLVNSPTFSANGGFAGVAGTTSYINSGWDPATNAVNFAQDSAFMAMRTGTNASGVTIDVGGPKASINPRNGSNSISVRGNMTTTSAVAAPGTTSAGVTAWDRSGAAAGTIYRDGASVTTFTTTSEALTTDDIFVCAFNNGGGTPTAISNRVVACVAWGAHMTGAQHAAFAAAIVL